MNTVKKLRTFGVARLEHADELCHQLACRFNVQFVILRGSYDVCSFQTRDAVALSLAQRCAIQAYIDGFSAGYLAASQSSEIAFSKEKLVCSNSCKW